MNCLPAYLNHVRAVTRRAASVLTCAAVAVKRQGDGVIKVEMHFLPDIYVPCDQCKGKRYNRETLEIKVQRQNDS